MVCLSMLGYQMLQKKPSALRRREEVELCIWLGKDVFKSFYIFLRFAFVILTIIFYLEDFFEHVKIYDGENAM